MKTALFPGAFDPFTVGHEDIVERALRIFDKVIIAIGINSEKKSYTPYEQRLEGLVRLYKDNPRVEVTGYQGLTMDFAHQKDACCIIRGVRSVQDYEYEMLLADVNKEMGDVETLFMVSSPKYGYISSTVVREMHRYGQDYSKLVPEGITL